MTKMGHVVPFVHRTILDVGWINLDAHEDSSPYFLCPNASWAFIVLNRNKERTIALAPALSLVRDKAKLRNRGWGRRTVAAPARSAVLSGLFERQSRRKRTTAGLTPSSSRGSHQTLP